jgi:hypothetical protein
MKGLRDGVGILDCPCARFAVPDMSVNFCSPFRGLRVGRAAGVAADAEAVAGADDVAAVFVDEFFL